MTPPALPATPKKRGCLMRAFLLLVGAFVVLILIAIITPTPPKTKEPSANVHVGQEKPATVDTAQAERRAARVKEAEERRATTAANPPVGAPAAAPEGPPLKIVPQQEEVPARNESEAERKALEEAKTEVAAENARKATLSVTAEEAVIKANATAKARNLPFKFKMVKESEDGIQYTFDDPEKLVLQFVGSPGSKPHGAFLIARGDGTIKSGQDILHAMILAIRGIDPKITQERANEIAISFVKEAAAGKSPKEKGVACVFSASMSPQIGFMMSVDPIMGKVR